MNKSIENWLQSSSYDIKTADAMFATKRHVYVIFVMHLNETSIPTRYPENIARIVKDYNKTTAQRYLRQTKALLKWLRAQLN